MINLCCVCCPTAAPYPTPNSLHMCTQPPCPQGSNSSNLLAAADVPEAASQLNNQLVRGTRQQVSVWK